MAWTYEAKTGVGWMIVIFVLTIIAIWAEVQTKSILPLIIPILGYVGFAAWVLRLKK